MNKSLILRVFLVLLVFCSAFYIAFLFLQPEYKSLPFYDPADVNPELVDPAIRSIGKGHKIADYILMDQNGQPFYSSSMSGKVWMADFFFTTCPSICKNMAVQKQVLQEHFSDEPRFQMVSHSVNPEQDSVPVLAAYAALNSVNYPQWKLLTGDKSEIYTLARKSFLVAREPTESIEHDFIHTENFVLIDQKGRIRGFYDGTSVESVQQLILDAEWLLERP
jgi:protein SCO1